MLGPLSYHLISFQRERSRARFPFPYPLCFVSFYQLGFDPTLLLHAQLFVTVYFVILMATMLLYSCFVNLWLITGIMRYVKKHLDMLRR